MQNEFWTNVSATRMAFILAGIGLVTWIGGKMSDTPVKDSEYFFGAALFLGDSRVFSSRASGMCAILAQVRAFRVTLLETAQMDPIYGEVLGAVFRWLLTLASSALVTKHIITAQQGEAFTTTLAHQLVLWAPAGAALLWSLLKHRANFLRRTDPTLDRRAPNTVSASTLASINKENPS